jgi:hypothetical protein
MMEDSSAELMVRRGKLVDESDRLRTEADGFREKAEHAETGARLIESEVAAIESILRERGELFDPEHARLFGVPIASALFDSYKQYHFRMLGSDWLSNGHLAWRVDVVPDGWRSLPAEKFDRDDAIGREAVGPWHSIDLSSPVDVGKSHDDHTFTDFQVSDAGLVRYRDAYWRAVQACGDEVRVTAASRSLVAMRDGIVTAVAMRMTGP